LLKKINTVDYDTLHEEQRLKKVLSKTMKREELTTSKFIDFDKYNEVFYDNLYIDDFKLVVKMPLSNKNRSPSRDMKISRFDLGKYTYLLSY